ncbi:hypothetical protein ARMSODRAFT_977827 [Armillaria solidipes]|uniref:Uncharacterized protein n=1 Tax=Armillaria solidipes TaxID=1076256 RepID=A0A2H3BSZ8_9AGAR|nr:hypothetical protein ARMSODRAFT_977827 [Armillaria solidipes]
MSAPPSFTDFEFHCGQGVPSHWMAAHAQSLYDLIIADLDKTTRLSRVTGVEAATLCAQRTSVFSLSFHRDLSAFVGKFWLAASDLVSSDADTGPSDIEEGHEDVGFRAGLPPTDSMDIDTIEEWVVEEETIEREHIVEEMVDMPTMQVACTLASLVKYGTSDDDRSREDEEEIKKERLQVKEEAKKKKIGTGKKKEKKGDDTDDEREEEEEEINELRGRQESDGAGLPPNVKGYTRTGWPTGLNQQLRQGKSQPIMHEKMLELVEEGLLERKNVTDVVGRADINVSCPSTLTMANLHALNVLSAAMAVRTESPA